MEIFWTICIIVVVYIFLVYIASRFIVPFMEWRGFEKPENVPAEIQAKITELESQAKNQEDFLDLVYAFVLQKTLNQWQHTRFRAATHIPRAFVSDLEEIWNTKEFVYCTGINYVVFVMLTGGRFFKPEDVRVRHVFVNFFIHQYLQVRIGDRWIDVDPAGTGIRDKPLGTHLAGFG